MLAKDQLPCRFEGQYKIFMSAPTRNSRQLRPSLENLSSGHHPSGFDLIAQSILTRIKKAGLPAAVYRVWARIARTSPTTPRLAPKSSIGEL